MMGWSDGEDEDGIPFCNDEQGHEWVMAHDGHEYKQFKCSKCPWQYAEKKGA